MGGNHGKKVLNMGQLLDITYEGISILEARYRLLSS